MPFDISSAVVGGVSALLSALALGNTVNRQHVKLQVTPVLGVAVPQGHPCVCVDVVNLSAFPVTITEIGFHRRDGKRYSILDQPLTNGMPLPQRLEPRESITAYFPPAIDLRVVTTAFARTSCGMVQDGDSANWKELRE